MAKIGHSESIWITSVGKYWIITNWVTTKGTTLGQRGATRDKSTRTEV